MKLQDYLHYYMGAKCTVARNDKQEYEDIVCLGLLIELQRREYKRSDHLSSIKPHLRRLSDISNSEAIAIASMAMFDKMPGYPISDYAVSKRGMGQYPATACQVAINNDWWDLEIAIGFNTGNIWYSKGEHRVFNQSIIFHTLLQQHFDLFNLIDAGLAIDAKTIKS